MSHTVPGPDSDHGSTSRNESRAPRRATPENAAPDNGVRSTPGNGLSELEAMLPTAPPPSGGATRLDQVLAANESRIAALRAEDDELARSMLRKVVAELDVLLVSARDHLRSRHGFWKRRRVKNAVKRDLATTTVTALPLREVADLLELPVERVDVVVCSLRARGALEPRARSESLAQIKRLRAQLRTVEATENHSMLDALVTFTVKITQTLAIVAAATFTTTVALGGRMIDGIALKASIIALVTALQLGADGISDSRRTRDPYVVARERLADLAAELEAVVEGEQYRYTVDVSVERFRLLIKTYQARVSLIDIAWSDKALCWNALGDLATRLSRSGQIRSVEANRALRTLRRLKVPMSRR